MLRRDRKAVPMRQPVEETKPSPTLPERRQPRLRQNRTPQMRKPPTPKPSPTRPEHATTPPMLKLQP